MTDREDADAAVLLSRVEAYWNELRGSHRLPRRIMLEPDRLGPARERALLFQRAGPEAAVLRSAGGLVRAGLGDEALPCPLTRLFVASARDRLAGILRDHFGGPAIVEVPIEALGGQRGRLLLLPLLGEDGLASAGLGVLAGPAPQPGERLGLAESGSLRRWLDGRPNETGPAEVPPVPDYIGAPKLRLVVDND